MDGGEENCGGTGLRMAVRLQDKGRECGLGLRPRVNADPVCDAQRHWGGICILWRYRCSTFYDTSNELKTAGRYGPKTVTLTEL